MKGKSLFVLLPLFSVMLTSCGQVVKYDEHLEDYVFAMKYHKNFNILQLTDIHWNMNTSTTSSKAYLDKVFDETTKHIKELQGNNAKIDLVELTGDQFMLSNARHVSSFVSYMEKKAKDYGFKYATIWGNHDRHGIYNPNWLSDRFEKADNSFYLDLNDNLYGRSNFVINLTDDGTKQGNTRYQLANLDSGASFSETAVSPFRDYDYIRKDQTDWYLKEHARVGENVPAIAYYHIPQDENEKLYQAVRNNGAANKNKFFKLEGFADNGNEKYASNFIDEAGLHGLKAAFMGHAHNVDWTVQDDNGVVIGLGVKTGPELYYAHIKKDSTDPEMKLGLESVGINEDFDLIGASLMTLTDELNELEGKFDLEHLYLNERKSNDFVRWVKW